MPRIHPNVLRRAQKIDAFLPRLIPVCRDVPSAQNELRWLCEHASTILTSGSLNARRRLLDSYVLRRSRGEPLQYILGSEYFGELKIKCMPGVLIPRQETAASISHLVHLVTADLKNKKLPATLHVLDLCSGTGCVPLLFHHDFYSKTADESVLLSLTGVDVSNAALKLARENRTIHIERQHSTTRTSLKQRALHGMTFVSGDVLHDAIATLTKPSTPLTEPPSQDDHNTKFDIVISNPPYISSTKYKCTISPSVRKYEPKLALVPAVLRTTDASQDGDTFYPRLLEIAAAVEAKIVLLEVADMDQAKRVVAMALRQGIWDDAEIWRDQPTSEMADESEVNGKIVKVFGLGHGRSVVAYRGAGTSWLGKK